MFSKVHSSGNLSSSWENFQKGKGPAMLHSLVPIKEQNLGSGVCSPGPWMWYQDVSSLSLSLFAPIKIIFLRRRPLLKKPADNTHITWIQVIRNWYDQTISIKMLPMYELLVICFNPAFGAWHWISEMIKSRVERAIQFFGDGPFEVLSF